MRPTRSTSFELRRLLQRTAALLAAWLIAHAAAGQTGVDVGPSPSTQSGPVVLRQTAPSQDLDTTRREERDGARALDRRDSRDDRDRVRDSGRTVRIGPDGQVLPPRKRPGEEFDVFVQRLAEPVEVRRFGADLMADPERGDAAEPSPSVPADYLVSPGDELTVTLWGSVVADLRLTVDRSGRVAIPRVGPVLVAGVRYAELDEAVRKRVAQVFRNFDLSVSLGRLRGKRVYVTGFVERPGAYTVSGLATITHVLLKAGGPSPAGSFRQIRLRRASQVVAEFDLYDLLLKGERTADRVV